MAKLNVFGGERFTPLHGAPFVESFGARRRFLKGAVGLAGASRPAAPVAGVRCPCREAGGLGSGPATPGSPAFFLHPGQPPGDTLWRRASRFPEFARRPPPCCGAGAECPCRGLPRSRDAGAGCVEGRPSRQPGRAAQPRWAERGQGEGMTAVPARDPLPS